MTDLENWIRHLESAETFRVLTLEECRVLAGYLRGARELSGEPPDMSAQTGSHIAQKKDPEEEA